MPQKYYIILEINLKLFSKTLLAPENIYSTFIVRPPRRPIHTLRGLENIGILGPVLAPDAAVAYRSSKSSLLYTDRHRFDKY